jgi:ATP synthase protein I
MNEYSQENLRKFMKSSCRSAFEEDGVIMDKKPDPQENPWRAAALVSVIGIDLVACMFFGYLLGTYLTQWMGGSPLWIVAGIMVGFLAGIVSVIYLIRHFMEGKNG